MIVISVQIKTAKTQKHLYCLVFTYQAVIRDFTYDHSIFLFWYGLMQGAGGGLLLFVMLFSAL